MKSKAYIDATIAVLKAKDKSAEEFGEAIAGLMSAVEREVYDAIGVSKDYGMAQRFGGVFDDVFEDGDVDISGNYVSADDDTGEPDKSYCVKGYITIDADVSKDTLWSKLREACKEEFGLSCGCSHDCCGHWFMVSMSLQLTDCGIDSISGKRRTWAFTFDVSYATNV